MAISVNTRRNTWTTNFKVSSFKSAVFPEIPIIEAPAFTIEKPPSAAQQALEELEEKYSALLESVQVDKFNAKYLSRYIANAEKRRGAPFTAQEKEQFAEMAKSGDPEKIRLLALELRIGVPRKVEREALAALGNLMLYRDQDEHMKAFMIKPDKDANLRAYVKTILMMNRVERWMGKYQTWKDKFTQVVSLNGMLPVFSQN